MRKFLVAILLLLVFPLIASGPFCGPYSFHAPITTIANGSTISGDSILYISLNGASNIHITKCRFTNSPGLAIKLFNCTNVIIDSCYFDGDQQGVYAQSSVSIKVNNNYFKNITGAPWPATYHPVQFDHVTGSGNQINYNKIEEVGVPYTHDQISVFQSHGLVGDSIQVWGNQIRGGQTIVSHGNGACGIGIDVATTYFSVRQNNLINTGFGGIQIIDDTTHMMARGTVDHNKIYSDGSGVALIGLSYQVSSGTTTIYVGNNNINWKRASDGTIVNIFATPINPPGWSSNTLLHTADPLANASIIPNPQVASCVVPPIISYSGSPYTFTVGTAISALTPTNTGGAAVSYSISPSLPSGLSIDHVTGVISGTPTTVNSGATYVVTATNGGGSGPANITITVNPAPILVPVINYVNNDVTYFYKTTITPNSPTNTGAAATSWSITPSLPSGLSFSTSTGIISGTPTVTTITIAYTITATNSHGSDNAVVNILINPINLTVTANNQTKAYGASLPALTLAYSGFASGDNTGSLATQPTASTLVTAGSNAGVYPINVSGGISPDYIFNYVPGNLTVTPVSLVITANNTSKNYGDNNPLFTASYTGFVNGDNSSNLLTLPSFSTDATLFSAVGTYSITPSGANSNNYTITYGSPGTLTINKAPLDIYANNASKITGSVNPPLTYYILGFKLGETQSVLSMQPTISTTAVTGSPVGTYPITVASATAANYNITFHAATLTVNSVPVINPTHWHHRKIVNYPFH